MMTDDSQKPEDETAPAEETTAAADAVAEAEQEAGEEAGEVAGAEAGEESGTDTEEAMAETGDEAAAPSNVAALPDADGTQHLRMLEALLFAASEPLDVDSLAMRLPAGIDVRAMIERLQADYAKRGVNLVEVGGKFAFRTAEDLSFLMQREAVQMRRLSRAAMETLAIIAYHQPVTRAEIEEIRGVSVAKGTLDVLLETDWVKVRGRKKVPGRPVMYGTTDEFLNHFGLAAISDLPGLEELKAAGLLDNRLPPEFEVPTPTEGSAEEEDDEDEENSWDDDAEAELALDEDAADPAEASGDDGDAAAKSAPKSAPKSATGA